MNVLHVELGSRSYPIHIGRKILTDSILLEQTIARGQVLIVSNTTVAPLYLERLQQQLSVFCEAGALILPDGEQYKSLETVNKIYDELIRGRYHRTATLVALGGGVVGDMTGFAAATYQRGVNFIQIPTTLLAQVDSSVGGKTGVNHPLGKNMIGAFYQPRAVLIDTSVLDTLPSREFSAGLAEVIKYGLICEESFFEWLENNISPLIKRDNEALEYAIQMSCHIKSRIVAADEYEKGSRALLNLGHTFGHAIEAYQGYGQWLHGEAVACGIAMATAISARRGWITETQRQRIRGLLKFAGLPVSPPTGMTEADFMDKMQLDKKILSGRIRYILPKGIGAALLVDDVEKPLIAQAIKDCS